MIQQIIFKSLLGWYKYLTGSPKQIVIASALIGVLYSGTRTAIEETTGIAQKRRERQKLLTQQEEKMIKDTIDSLMFDLNKERDERFEEMARKVISEG